MNSKTINKCCRKGNDVNSVSGVNNILNPLSITTKFSLPNTNKVSLSQTRIMIVTHKTVRLSLLNLTFQS